MADDLKTGHWTYTACDICGAQDHQLLGERHYVVAGRTRRFAMEFQDMACRECGFVFAGKRPDEAFLMDYYRDAHIGHRGGETHFDAEARAATVASHVPAGGQIVEVGANDGAFTAILREKGFDAFGFDPNEADEARDVAKGFAGKGETARPIASADAMVAYYVLEHVIAPREWLAELARYLKPGGTLIVEVPNYTTHPEDSLNMEHLLHFTPESLKRLLAISGFELISTPPATMGYGQTAVARYTAEPHQLAVEVGALSQALAAYDKAKSAREARAAASRKAVACAIECAHGRETPVFIWGANEYAERAARLLPEHFDHVEVLDKSDSKLGKSFADLDRPIAHPDARADVVDAIFLVCSPNWNAQIAAEIAKRPAPALAVIDAVTGEKIA